LVKLNILTLPFRGAHAEMIAAVCALRQIKLCGLNRIV
jgi:hypothetical protein